MNTNVFLLFFSFVFCLSPTWERERERVDKIGYKEKQSQSYLSYLDGFMWRIFLLSRALLLPGVLGFSSVRHEPCPTTDFLIIYLRWREGVPTSVLGSQSIIWLHSSSPWSGDSLGLLDVTPYPILYASGHQVQTSVFPFWPGFVTLGFTYNLSCLNGHSLMACHC